MREITLNDLQLQDSAIDWTITRWFKETIGTDELWVRVIWWRFDKPLLVSVILSLWWTYIESPCKTEVTITRVKDDKKALKIINDSIELLLIQREWFYNITVSNEVHYK